MNNIKYLKYLIKHKFYVTRECFRVGMYWRGLVHDLSKFNPMEWKAYRNYFYGGYTRPYADFNAGLKCEFGCWAVSKEGVSEAFDFAWLHHQHKNKHHWQYWILREDNGTIKTMDMPYDYVVEMVCDWIGAGMAITGKREADKWYAANKDKMQLSPLTRERAEMILVDLI